MEYRQVLRFIFCIALYLYTGIPTGVAQKADTALMNRWYDSMVNNMETEPDKAILFVHKGLSESIRGGNLLWEGYFLQSGGIIHDLANRLDSGLYYFEKTIEVSKKNKDITMEANALGNIGVAYHERGYLQPALNYHLAAARLRETTPNKQHLGKSYNNIGLLYRIKKDYPKAMEYFNKSLDIKLKNGDKEGMSTTLLNIGSCFQHKGEYDSALHYARKSIELSRETNNDANVASSTGNIGMALLAQGKSEEAIEYLNDAIILHGNKGSDDEYFSIFHGLSKYYMDKGELNKSKQIALTALQKARNANRLEQQAKFLKSLANIHKKEGNSMLAFEYLENATALSDSLLNQANIRQLNEMNILYETEQKENRIEELTTESLENKLRLLEGSTQRNILLTALGFTAIIALIIAITLKQNQKKNLLLKEQKEIIEAQLKEKEILMGEIHHRVKNNLQIISGLLNLQSRHIADPNALQAVREGRNRVKSIALIHQQLYQRESLTTINLQHYLKDLLQSVHQSFKDSDKEISHELNCPMVLLDVETAVPIGLIINELVTNSYKYAFNEKKTGSILVGIELNNPAMTITVMDSGKGLPHGFDWQQQHSFGIKMISTLVNKLKANFTMDGSHGTRFQMKIPDYSNIA